MPTRLIALDAERDAIMVDSAPLIMGRDRRCDARLNSSRVSRFHCCITLVENTVHVCDLGSTNGTRINGRWVRSGYLHRGDELAIADMRYRVEQSAFENGKQ
jgi:pSer/pThr/pTyr-binding forkhead associated (FHA) protein